MNWKKILTAAALTGFSASVATGQGTAPTIIQGDYVSNVFGQSNFVKNPNAKLNNKNVTVTTATATRSTTTPLVATTEWNVTITSANGTAAWATRTFDAGMKNQNCEARFTYRGFQATSKAQIKQGANVVAELVLTPSATDPRIASINFPCGDLSSATTFVITDTATLAGTNEIGGIYVGLATNQANVAQAEYVVNAYTNGALSIPNSADTTVAYQSAVFNKYGEYNPATGTFTASRAGDYLIEASTLTQPYNWTSGELHSLTVYSPSKGIAFGRDRRVVDAALSKSAENRVVATASLNAGDTIQILLFQNQGATVNLINDSIYNRLNIYRFPSSSELVVTPETQNVWGGVVYTGSSQTLFNGTAEPTAYSPYTNAVWNLPTALKGKAAATTTNSGNDLGFSISNLPVGNYKLDVTGLLNAGNGSTTTGASTICNFKLVETTTSTDVARQIHQDHQYAAAAGNETRNYINAFSGVFTNTSVATRNFRIEAQKHLDTTPANSGVCQAFSATSSGNNSNIAIIMTPLDNNANSALYVQGPVKAAGTGTDIPTGYIGEVRQDIAFLCGTSGDYTDGASVTITPGVWQVQSTYNVGGPGNIFDLLTFTGTPGSNSWRLGGYNDGWISAPGFAQPFGRMNVSAPMQFIRYDGTTMYLYYNGSWQQATASATGEITARFLRNTASCTAGYSSIQAIRIN